MDVNGHLPEDPSSLMFPVLHTGSPLARAGRILKCAWLASVSVLRCSPMLLRGRPRTPLRLLCVAAFEYLARLQGVTLGRRKRLAMAYACDFGALRNDFYDQHRLDLQVYRTARRTLRRLVPEAATRQYILSLRSAERGRPALTEDGFPAPGAVAEYRAAVLAITITWLQQISTTPVAARDIRLLQALAELQQLADDILDWKDDRACCRPTYVTAFLRESGLSPVTVRTHLRHHADRLTHFLLGAARQDAAAAPLAVAGMLTWLFVIVLVELRFRL